mmetsp:Transcript_84038/g.175783  ORF Transcript_84038/g.175783 Transcript_84038/m.175783 type:complete len:97 (-) Transcript_84038:743-1033(-)
MLVQPESPAPSDCGCAGFAETDNEAKNLFNEQPVYDDDSSADLLDISCGKPGTAFDVGPSVTSSSLRKRPGEEGLTGFLPTVSGKASSNTSNSSTN